MTKELVLRAEVKNLVFSYGEKKVLNGITLPIYEDRVTALIGPSGWTKRQSSPYTIWRIH
jgi:phosphate transport system ATP-binding protein